MSGSSLFQMDDSALERAMLSLLARDCAHAAQLIAHLAEFDARRLYARDGYPSMYDWCVGKAHLSEDAALKRIRAARAAREHPLLLPALADGRLHLSAVVLLAPWLTRENAAELVDEATHRAVSPRWFQNQWSRRPVPALRRSRRGDTGSSSRWERAHRTR